MYEGMTLRDWFAGQALTAIASRAIASSINNNPDTVKTCVETTYKWADEMLITRSKN